MLLPDVAPAPPRVQGLVQVRLQLLGAEWHKARLGVDVVGFRLGHEPDDHDSALHEWRDAFDAAVDLGATCIRPFMSCRVVADTDNIIAMICLVPLRPRTWRQTWARPWPWVRRHREDAPVALIVYHDYDTTFAEMVNECVVLKLMSLMIMKSSCSSVTRAIPER